MKRYHCKIQKLIEKRVSWRTYDGRYLEQSDRNKLNSFFNTLESGPFGNRAQFRLLAAQKDSADELRGLGTYGFIKNARAYLVGAIPNTLDNRYNLEDYGYLMEQIILYATDIDLDTCWLGGSFNRSNFAERIYLNHDETMPAISPVGYRAKKRGTVDKIIRRVAGSKNRLPWEKLFFTKDFSQPLSEEIVENYRLPLEMVRLAPSASNKQPWRIISDSENKVFHFFLQRTPGYRITEMITQSVDLQRIDMGIAMCHFELMAEELGIKGEWRELPIPSIKIPDLCRYLVSWIDRSE